MKRLASRTFSLCLLLFVFAGSKGQGSQCQNGWFGDNCQYRCHCLNNEVCDKVTGECPGDCDRLWFGPQCQYVDAAHSTSSPLTDGIESTCLDGTGLSQHFQMNHYETRFTWMRFVTNGPGKFDRVNITFISRIGGKVTPKSSLTKIYSSDTVLYLYGELEDRFKTIRLDLDSPETRQSFCSMQVSSGRNVALKQNASQSSTYRNGGAENAVDGTGSCTSTNYEDSPYWTLHLSQPVTVNYYRIQGRHGSSERCRLRYFRLESYLNSTKVFQYDKTDASDPYYSFKYPWITSPITSVKLTISKFFWPNDQVRCIDNRLSLCDIGIYGDMVCPPGKWGRDCEKDCKNCQESFDSCFVSTGMCTSGCKAGFYGPHCQEECPDGQWGVDCLNRCDNCLNGKCNKISGECLSGCYWGYKMPYCVQECDAGFHGYNCILACPANCQGNICNNVDGTCAECVAGFQGPMCDQECNATFYGANCSTPCSGMCIDQLCHHITGLCHNCPDGKQISMDCSQDELNVVSIVVPIVVVLLVVAALIFGIWFWRRRKSQHAKREAVGKKGEMKGATVKQDQGGHQNQSSHEEVQVRDNRPKVDLYLNEQNQGIDNYEKRETYCDGETPTIDDYTYEPIDE